MLRILGGIEKDLNQEEHPARLKNSEGNKGNVSSKRIWLHRGSDCRIVEVSKNYCTMRSFRR